MICSTRHHLLNLNTGKRTALAMFINDYSNFVKQVIDDMWENGYSENIKHTKTITKIQNGEKIKETKETWKLWEFDVRQNKFDLPRMIKHTNFNAIESDLSGRARSAAVDHASGIIRSVIEKTRRVFYANEEYDRDIEPDDYSKPEMDLIYPQLASLCCDFEFKNSKFMGFLQLKSIGKKYGKIRIPIPYNANVERNGGNLKKGCMITPDYVQLVWEVPTIPNKGHKIVGADQGISTLLTLSDGQITDDVNEYGYSLSDIMDILSRRKKGSKAFLRAQKHRNNFINQMLNRLDFSEIKELRIEDVKNLRKGKHTNRKMTHWTYTLIKTKLLRICEKHEVRVIEQNSVYRSQRCSCCGWVQKSNRKGKDFECKACGFTLDADLNAAKNHAIDLPRVSFLCGKRYNISGFYWKSDGIFDSSGSELLVPNDQNN